MPFPDAYRKWLSARTTNDHPEVNVRYIAAETLRTYDDYFRALEKFFSEMAIAEIHDGHLRTYQEWRSVNYDRRWGRRAGQNRIRKEIGLLIRIMKAAGSWGEDMHAFQQLPVQLSEMRRALSPEEQARLLQVMAQRDDWLWIFCYTVLALRTSASTCELRGLRLKDIDLEHRTLRIGPEASKNKYRNRTIPLVSEDAIEAVNWLMSRARRMGAVDPEHYLFPFGVGHSHVPKPDPSRPMTKWAISHNWAWIREKAGLPHLRPYDLRHTAITRMAEAGIPIATIMGFAGHVSPKMSEYYTTVSMQAKREAGDVLESVHPSMSLEGTVIGGAA
ncbi:MAG TPA: site-specific integrase [Acidobacteriaceae bacterium]|jgi:integrase|nr:site-specific integrase [Acidobacteriaceae bacterium]